MSTHIPEDILRSIKQAANIRQVVEEYVALKKSGRNWIGICPFHSDKDPSFSVSEDRQIFYCFGCGEGGDVFKFLMKIQGMSFVEAARHLAGRYGIIIPEKPLSAARQRKQQKRRSLIELNEFATDYFHRNLIQSKSGGRALEYLSARGISLEIIRRFRLGWAQDSWDGLIRYLQSHGRDLDAAEQAGLIVSREGGRGYYDRFRARITFPILDESGRVAAIGGRLIGEGRPKYLNSPETPLYHKSRILYGFYQNKGSIRRSSSGYVVEGYMDLLALVQSGLDQVVATLGTALTQEHASRIKSLTRDWTLVFDGDSAGIKAAVRALPILYGEDIRPRVMILPHGHDPDSFVREAGPEKFCREAEQASSGIDFAVEHGLDIHGRGPEGKAKVVDDVLPILQAVQDPIRKSLLVGHVCHKVGVREDDLWQKLGPSNMGRRGSRSRSVTVPVSRLKGKAVRKKYGNRAEGKVLGFLLAHPHHLPDFLDSGMELWLEDMELKELFMCLTHVFSMNQALDLNTLTEHLASRPEMLDLAARLKNEFPPCKDTEVMCRDLKKYCEERKKKALRVQVLEQLRTGTENVNQEELLRQLERLR